MTGQPARSITAADVERIVRRDFGADRAGEIAALLDGCGTEEWHREPDRVRLACLKLAAESIENLCSQLEAAKYDYRDVLAAAEYPGHMKRQFRMESLSPGERQWIIDADWRQYQEWLTNDLGGMTTRARKA